jgi:hypothetical protein
MEIRPTSYAHDMECIIFFAYFETISMISVKIAVDIRLTLLVVVSEYIHGSYASVFHCSSGSYRHVCLTTSGKSHN